MRKKKALYTAITAVVLQVVLIIVNLILPHFIILKYGSNVNGLINSITQFLGYIALLETGIGSVIKSVLYKALVKKDNKELSGIVSTTQSFFKKICIALVIYVLALCVVYPLIVIKEFAIFYTISLLLIIAINSFMQYYFGLANQILLQADQKGYVVNICKIVTYIISTIVMIIMIYMNFNIQWVKGIGTIIMIISPLYYYGYVKKNYSINRNVNKDKNLLSQRWDGFAHQVSAFIHNNTDIALLTLFSNMSEVSVYSVYALVTSGLKSIIGTLTNSISATFGNLYGNGEKEKLEKQFRIFDYFNLLVVVFVFTIAGFLITPFIKLYVAGATDANYNRVGFGIILVIAEAIYCLRCSYSNIIFVVGDFKQTKKHGYIESGLNIIISLILIKSLGLLGIAIGTLLGMTYRWIASIVYLNKNIIQLNIKDLVKKYIVNITSIIIFIFINSFMDISKINSYSTWILYAIISCIILGTIMLIINMTFCKKDLKEVCNEYIKK